MPEEQSMCNEISYWEHCDLCWDAQNITVQFLTGEHYFQFHYPARLGNLLLRRLTRNGWRLADLWPLIEENAADAVPSRFCYHFQRPANQEAQHIEQIGAL